MDPITGIAAIAGPILGGIFGSGQAAGNLAEAKYQIEEAVKQLEAVGVPSSEAMQITLQHLQSAGQLTPELEEAIGQKDTELKNIHVDPRSREAQYRALGELEDVGEGGLRLSDRAAMEDALGDVATANRGRREALEGSLKARGAFGSGAELASRLAGDQEAAQQGNEIALKTAGMAQDRALQAIIEAGEMGGNIRASDFGEQKAVADAQDQIEAFNTANRRDVVARNIAAKNAAREYNLKNDQRIMDENVGISNQQEVHNRALPQQEYDNRMQKAQAVANARVGQAGQTARAAKEEAAKWGKVGQGVGQIGATLATASGNRRPSDMGPGSFSGVDESYTKPDEEERYWA